MFKKIGPLLLSGLSPYSNSSLPQAPKRWQLLQILNMYRYTVRTQLCYIIRYYTTYQLHVSAITWPSSGCTKPTEYCIT
jgi:hypothetical protein